MFSVFLYYDYYDRLFLWHSCSFSSLRLLICTFPLSVLHNNHLLQLFLTLWSITHLGFFHCPQLHHPSSYPILALLPRWLKNFLHNPQSLFPRAGIKRKEGWKEGNSYWASLCSRHLLRNLTSKGLGQIQLCCFLALCPWQTNIPFQTLFPHL